jgi:hypothetical protein
VWREQMVTLKYLVPEIVCGRRNTLHFWRQVSLAGSAPIHDHFAWRKNGDVVLNKFDESTITPGLFVAGPQLRHQKIIFCFIYKFRQRFAVIGKSIAERLGLSMKHLEAYRDSGMMLEDLACCKAECKC